MQPTEPTAIELRRLLKPGQVLSDPADLLTYESDAGLERGQADGVLFPETESDVIQIVRWANKTGVPLVPRGAGTGTSGGAVAGKRGLIVEFSRMNHVLSLDEVGKRVTVEPGVVNGDLDDCVKSKGLFFPPDPASGRVCTLGGNVAENAGGPRCFKYGVVTNYVTGLKVILADGRTVRFGGRALDYPEYDWLGVLTGSEGTLGIVVQINLRLLRRSDATTMIMGAFDSIEEAGQAVSDIIGRGLAPATIEMMDQAIVKIVEDYSHIGLPVHAAALLIIEVNGSQASLAPQAEELTAALRAHRILELSLPQTPEERDRIWRARKDSAGALAWLAPAYYASDCTVPRSKIAVTLREINRICDANRVPVCYLLHAGDGNLHPHYLVADADDHELMERVQAVEAQVLEFCVKQGGSITGEHGVGLERRNFMPLMYNDDELQAMLDVKEIFDPRGLLNPGKIFPEQGKRQSAKGKSERQNSAKGYSQSVIQNSNSEFAPRSAEEAAEVIRTCLTGEPPKSIRVLGGGTKSKFLSRADIILSTENLRGIRAYVPEDLYVTVGAGTTCTELQKALERDRMWVPLLSPWPESTLGGIASTLFNAPLRMRYGYGSIRDLVLAMTVALPDGRIIRVGRPVVKNVAGYDLPKLFVGAFGTLGLITELTLKISPRPRSVCTLVIPVEDCNLGLKWGQTLQRHCVIASALLLCKGCSIPGFTSPYSLVYTAEGLPQDVDSELDAVQTALRTESAPEGTRTEQFSGSELWATWLRSPSPLEATLRIGAPATDLPGLLQATLDVLGSASFICDMANGLLYVKGSIGPAALQAVRDLSLAADGYAVVLSGPAGNGSLDRWGFQPEGLDLMRAIKARWDPRRVFNPGAFLV